MAKLVSKIYGDALFDLAVESDRLDDITEDVLTVRRAFLQNPELMRLLENPDISKTEKLDLMERVFKGRISDDVVGFIIVVVTKERYRDMDHILEYYITKVKEHKKIGVAVVTSPMELSESWKRKIRQKLLDTTKYVEMEVSYEIDPSLIGGLKIRIGDTVVDSSIKSKLEEISKKLLGVSLEQKLAERIETS